MTLASPHGGVSAFFVLEFPLHLLSLTLTMISFELRVSLARCFAGLAHRWRSDSLWLLPAWTVSIHRLCALCCGYIVKLIVRHSKVKQHFAVFARCFCGKNLLCSRQREVLQSFLWQPWVKACAWLRNVLSVRTNARCEADVTRGGGVGHGHIFCTWLKIGSPVCKVTNK